ncbi:hypothetical protein G114_12378 [Aeromonas diversa CDC 2478-85]|uniref:Uncharacterized protein n=1 Tax=Aeromonas diversa CDC 2478-85 TaxID=1268237 RepID=N9VJ23_9GAMM|nr:hypothetical protein G114_12378 [Aeromonas diversa CDC 2478-85]
MARSTASAISNWGVASDKAVDVTGEGAIGGKQGRDSGQGRHSGEKAEYTKSVAQTKRSIWSGGIVREGFRLLILHLFLLHRLT